MKIVNIIPAKRWVHTSGKTASIYGAVPWTNEQDKANWTIVTNGYTWQLDNMTIGIGRTPAKTLAEAMEIAKAFNDL